MDAPRRMAMKILTRGLNKQPLLNITESTHLFTCLLLRLTVLTDSAHRRIKKVSTTPLPPYTLVPKSTNEVQRFNRRVMRIFDCKAGIAKLGAADVRIGWEEEEEARGNAEEGLKGGRAVVVGREEECRMSGERERVCGGSASSRWGGRGSREAS